MTASPFTIVPARSAEQIAAAATLFTAYAGSIGFDLSYQDFDTEVSTLPGKYAPPLGELLLALDPRGAAIGCVGLRALTRDVCEMKRLYVAPAGRGLGLGRALAETIVAAGANLGYREMRLDTLPTMSSAIRLYETLGFNEIAPYYDTPVEGTIFMAKSL
jgi:ribosomal protein S18 acetylase RimI-like enzyme